MSNIKKSVVIVSFLLLLILVIHTGRMFMINNNNFYALEAGSIEEANNALLSMDITTNKNFSTKDFYGEYVPKTSFVISYQGRVYYDQGYYMVYKKNYEPVYCIDPLKTAWSVTNKDSLDEINNHGFSNLSTYQQDLVSRLVIASQELYNQTNDPEYLVGGQLLVWQAVGAGLESYTPTIQDNMDEIEQKAASYNFADAARGGTGDLNYYDTDGQDLIGVPDTTNPDTTNPDTTNPDTTDPDTTDPTAGDVTIEKTSNVAEGDIVENGQEIKYTLTIKNNTNQAMDINVEDKLIDGNISAIDSAYIYVNGQETTLTVSDLKSGITLENLAPNDSVTIQYTVTVDLSADYEEEDPIVNTAKVCIVDSEICDEDIITIGTTDKAAIEAQKSISDTKGNNDGIAQNGEELTFDIEIFNQSTTSKTPVVTDDLNDPNIVYNLNNPIYVDDVETSYTVEDLGDGGVALDEIESGQSVVLSFDATASSEYTFSSKELEISNFSNICSGDECVEATAYMPVGGFEVDKTVTDANNNKVAEPGENLSYKIVIENYNQEITSMTIKDTLSRSYVNIDESAPLTITTNGVTTTDYTFGDLENGFTLDSVVPGDSVTIEYNIPVKGDLEVLGNNYHINNVVNVCISGIDCLSDSAAITIDEDHPVIPGGDKAIIKTIKDQNNNGVAEPGENLTFDVMLVNGSKTSETFVVQDDLLDENVEYIMSNNLEQTATSQGSFGKDNPTVQDLKDGLEIVVDDSSYFEFTFDAKVKDPLANTAKTDIFNGISACIDEVCTEGGGLIPLDSTVAFEVDKNVLDADGDGVIQEGESFEYKISVTNVGNDIASVVLKDVPGEVNVDFDVEQSLVVNTTADITPKNPVLDDVLVNPQDIVNPNMNSGLEISGLNPGEVVEISFTGVGKTNMLTGSYILSNVAQVVWEEDGNIGFDVDSANIFTNSKDGDVVENISLEKKSKDENNDGIVSLGEKVEYNIFIANPTSSEQEVEIKDFFDDVNMEYNMSDEFLFEKTNELASITGTTLGDLKAGVVVTMPPNSVVNISYSGIALLEPKDPAAVLDYNEVEYCSNSICNTAISTLDKEGRLKFDVNKTAKKDGKEVFEAEIGDTINYEIAVENTGNIGIDNLEVTDVMDDNLIYDPTDLIVVKNQSGQKVQTTPEEVTIEDFITNGVIINHIDTGDVVTITYDIDVYFDGINNMNSYLTNAVTVCDEEKSCLSDAATISIDPINKPIDPDNPGDISIVKNIQGSSNDGTTSQGDNLKFTINIINSGNTGVQTLIQDALDDPNIIYDELEPLTIKPISLYEGQTVGDLKSGITLTIPAKTVVKIEFTGTVKSGDEFDENQSVTSNLVTACYKDAKGDDLCSDGGGSLTLPNTLGFSLEKDVLVNGVDTTEASLGDNLTYNISIVNTKNSPIDGFSLKDTYPKEYINVPDVELEILKDDGSVVDTTPEIPRTSDLFNSGILINEELMPSEGIEFSYEASITSDLSGSDIKHLTNLISASSDTKLASTKSDAIISDDYLYAFDSATVTLDPTHPVVDDFSVLKTVQDEDGDNIASEGEELTYTIYISNLSDAEKVLKVEDFGDVNNNSILDSSLTITPNTTPVTGDLVSGDLEVTLAPGQTVQISYNADVAQPLNNSSASYLYNNVEVCNTLELDKCTDSATKIPLVTTKGFDVDKTVEINRKGTTDVDELTEAVMLGDILDYNIRITNNKNTTLENINVVDIIDPNIGIDYTGEYSIQDMNGDDVTISSSTTLAQLLSPEGIIIPKIEPGEYVDIKFSSLPLNINAINAPYNHLTNLAKVCVEETSKVESLETEDGLCASDTATITNDVTNPPIDGISIIKQMTDQDGDGIAHEGEELNFKIFILNTSADKKDIEIVDELNDPNINYTLSDPIDISPVDTVTTPKEHTVGNLTTGLVINTNPGDLITLEFQAKVASPLNEPTNLTLENNIEACADGVCTNGGGSVDLPGSNGFYVEKTVAINDKFVDPLDPLSYIIKAGDDLSYKITITNNRNTDLENLEIEDKIDDNIIVDKDDTVNPLIIKSTDSSNPDHLNPKNKTIASLFDGTLIIDQIKVGETITLEYNAQVKASIDDAMHEQFSNIVQVCTKPISKNQSSVVGDEICGADSITLTTNSEGIIDPDSLIGVVKEVTDENENNISEPGEELLYNIIVYNPKDTTEDLVVVDLLDDVNIDYDLTSPLDVAPIDYLKSPNPATVGDLKDGVTLTIPQGGFATISYEANLKSPLSDTGAFNANNSVEVCYFGTSECSNGGGTITVEGNENFTIEKVGTYEGEVIDEDEDLILDGSTITYYIQIQNTGNTPIENIKILDLQDDNLVSDYTKELQLVEDQTTQDPFDITSVTSDGTVPEVGDLFSTIPSLGYDSGIVIPVLDPAKKITFKYESKVEILTGDELESTNIVEACAKSELSTKGDSVLIDGDLCANDGFTIQLKDHPSKGTGIKVLKLGIDGLDSDTTNLILEPGEDITYYILIKNDMDIEYNFSILDNPDPNIEFNEEGAVDVIPSSYLTYPTSGIKIGDLINPANKINFKIPAGRTLVLSYTGVLKDEAKGLDLTAQKVSNHVESCNLDIEICGYGDSNIDILGNTIVDVQKSVTTTNDLDSDSDLMLDVVDNEKISYNIHVKNSGNVNTDIKVSDKLPKEYLQIPDLMTRLNYSLGIETEPINPTVGDFINEGVVFKNIEPGQEFDINFDSYVKNDLSINGVEYSGYITNVVEACSIKSSTGKDSCSNSQATVEYGDPDFPFNPNMLVTKHITDTDGDNIASPGEELEFDINVINLSSSNQTYVVGDTMEDLNVDYESIKDVALEQVGGTGIFLSSPNTVSDLKDDPKTPEVEGIEVKIDPYQNIEFVFKANVYSPLNELYNSHITNVVNLTDGTDSISSSAVIELPKYERLDVTKTYTTDYSVDTDTNPLIVDNMYYVTGEGDFVNYRIDFTNIGTNSLSNFIIKDELNKTYYKYAPKIKVHLTSDNGVDQNITLEELVTGYTFMGTIDPGEKVSAEFTVQVNEKISETEDGFVIPNIAIGCFDNTNTSEQECISSGSKTPYYKTVDPTDPPKKPDDSFIIDKWIDDSTDFGGNGNGVLEPDEPIKMHILVNNNTTYVNMFENDGEDLAIEITDDLTDPNFDYNLRSKLSIYNITTKENVVENDQVVSIVKAELSDIDSDNESPLILTIKDGDTLEIIFDTKATSDLL